MTHYGDTIFATWFTFGADGKPLWLVVSAPKVDAGRYSGKLFTGFGPKFDAPAFDPGQVVSREVGDATFNFVNGNSASFSYTVGRVAQTRLVTREVFAPLGTVCQ